MKKLTTQVEGVEQSVEWLDHFWWQETAGTDRLVIGAKKPVDLLCKLAPLIGPEYYLLYILACPRGEGEPGRYESRPMALAEVEMFLKEFESFFEQDARHQIWIGSTKQKGMLILESHGLIYAYGPLKEIEIEISGGGFVEREIVIPGPHSHHYRSEFDAESQRVLNATDWYRTDLKEGDDW